MKHIIKYLAFSFALIMLINACTKTDNLPYYASGTASVLTGSVSKVKAVSKDSLKVGLVLNWSDPKYATSAKTEKFIIEFDSSGRNFAKSVKYTVTGVLTDTFTNRDLNNILLGFGFNFNVAYNVDIRVTSSYGNNNDQAVSNTITVNMTPYVTPPVVVPPFTGSLFIVGSATASFNPTNGGWQNPVPDPLGKFAMIDSVTYVGVFNLTGGGQYLLLPKNSSWDYKYAVIDPNVPNIASGSGGSFGYYTSANNTAYNSNIPAPANSGWYTIKVDFQHGIYSVNPYIIGDSMVPSQLVLVGDYNGWSNTSTPASSAIFTQLNSCQFQISAALPASKSYLILPNPGSWDYKYAVESSSIPAAGGTFGYYSKYNNTKYNSNFSTPATQGTYTITTNFYDNTFTVQ